MAFEIDLPLPEDPHAEKLAARLTEVDNAGFLSAVLGDGTLTIHHRSSDTLLTDPEVEEQGTTWSLLLRAIHLCFAAHLPLSLSPDLLWYTVVHEVALHVRLNADTYAGLFTATPGEQQTIEVRDDLAPLDWQRSINLVQQPLRDRIGDEIADLFQPAFSTTTPVEATAVLVTLMDVVSPYYRFRWITLCGIPRIRLEGRAADWRLLARRVRELAEWFDGLSPWFERLHPVLRKIADTAGGGPVDEDFWRSLYKRDEASGGPYVSGWITAFFAHTQSLDGPVLKTGFDGSYLDNEFPCHVSRVPFEWETPAGTFDMTFLAGVLGIERDGEWIRPRLGHAVAHFARAEPVEFELPDGWTIDAVRQASGCAEAELLSPDLAYLLEDEPRKLRPTCAIGFADHRCLVQADGSWYPGEWFEDEAYCGVPVGPDLAAAIRSL